MEHDPSCYMYFEENCNRFSRCELGGGVLYCQHNGRFQKVGETFQEPGDENCWHQFDEKCVISGRCDRATSTTTTTTEPGSETCEYNGRRHPKEEKLWYMEHDLSCYMYFEENCNRFSRCELGGGVFYCKYEGRYRKVGEWFDDPDDPLCMIKFSSRCGALTTCIWIHL